MFVDRAQIPVLNATAKAAVQAIKAKLDSADHKYKVVAIPHVLTTTGFRMPLKNISDLVHAYGAYLVVDGAQAPGGIKVNFHATGADAYATSSHKWQLAPKGSGILCMTKAFKTLVRSTYLFGETQPSLPSFGIKLSSSGTLPAHTIAGQGAAFSYLDSFGMDNVERWNLHLRQKDPRPSRPPSNHLRSPSATQRPPSVHLRSLPATLRLKRQSSLWKLSACRFLEEWPPRTPRRCSAWLCLGTSVGSKWSLDCITSAQWTLLVLEEHASPPACQPACQPASLPPCLASQTP